MRRGDDRDKLGQLIADFIALIALLVIVGGLLVFLPVVTP